LSISQDFQMLALIAENVTSEHFGAPPTYCVRKENKKVQNRNDIQHFSFKLLVED
jgi:hypothetical protein